MKCNGLRVVASRLVDAMPVYARFMPLFVEKKNSRQKGGQFGRIKNTEGVVIWDKKIKKLGQLIKNSQIVGEEEEEESNLINLKR